jgi:hypothetical protein
MGFLNLNTGANHGKKDFEAMCLQKKRGTGSNWRAEDKRRKQLAKKEAAQDRREMKREAKKEAERMAKEEAKALKKANKKGFWS